MPTIVGLFESRDEAAGAVDALRREGFEDAEIGVVTTEDGAGPAEADPDTSGEVLVGVTVPAGREVAARALLEQERLRAIDERPTLDVADEPALIHPERRECVEETIAEEDRLAMAGGTAGGVVGGVAGALIGGPVGAAIGAAIGMATGAMVGSLSDHYSLAEAEFRTEWERGTDSGPEPVSWEHASTAHRYGWEGHEQAEARDALTWAEARPHLEHGWNGAGSWIDHEPMVRSGWERRARMGLRPGPAASPGSADEAP